MSTQTTALSDLGDALITCGFKAKVTSLNKCEFLSTSSMISGDMTPNSLEYGSPIIFIYDLDLERQGLLMESGLMF